MDAIIAGIAGIVVALVTVVGTWLSRRNSRSVTNEEIKLLEKLRPGTPTYNDLQEIIERRVARWWKLSSSVGEKSRSSYRMLVGAYAVIVLLLARDRDPISFLTGSVIRWSLTGFLGLLILGALTNLLGAVRDERLIDKERANKRARFQGGGDTGLLRTVTDISKPVVPSQPPDLKQPQSSGTASTGSDASSQGQAPTTST